MNEQQTNSSSIWNAEQQNRVIVILLILLLLAVFMDHQATRRYIQLSQQEIEKSSASELLQEELAIEKTIPESSKTESPSEQIPSVYQPIQAQAKEILGKISITTQSDSSNKRELQEKPQEKPQEKLQKEPQEKPQKEHQEKLQEKPQKEHQGILRKKVSEILRAVHSPRSKRNSFFSPDIVHHQDNFFYLYFIRFHQGKTRLTHVKRYHSGGDLSLRKVLQFLQKGPNLQERGLINNFDKRIQIHKILIIRDTAVIDVNQDIKRLGSHVIKDRLEQLNLTLTQFQQISSIKILVNGKYEENLNRLLSTPSITKSGKSFQRAWSGFF